jgi:Subtilase family
MRILVAFIAALSGALCGSQAALAQDTIRLRAISPKANDPAVIHYIAQNAATLSEVIPDGADRDTKTIRSVINSRCGSIQPAYVEEFQKINKLDSVDLEAPLGSADSGLMWPACLYVAIFPGGYPTILKKDELVSHAYVRLTGGGGTEAAIQNFFAGIDINKVQPGATLRAPYVTRPVPITLDQGTADAFWLALQKEANQTPGIETVISRINAPDFGAVIVADENFPGCKPQDGSPFDVKAVLDAFAHAKERASQERIELRRPKITVVDNGFFGADSRVAESAAFDGSPFPPKMFLPEPGSVVAKRFETGKDTIFPINYSNHLEPDSVSGHGTHVTGLILGGPAFLPYHDRLRGPDGWADITILNVGAGRKSLIEGADRLLVSSLDGSGGIVNMSIAYNREAYRNISTTFDDLFRTRRYLYIASAGNDGTEVQDKVYPAGSGGPLRDNVITVAALDNDGRFAPFSNQGARTVDLAAPGCEIQSWTRNTKDEYPLSGTSQAAPLVTFAAALLRTFSGDLDVRYLKARLVASGSLLYPKEQAFTAFRVGLNIPRALYWFDDYVRVRKEKPAAAPATDRPEAVRKKEWEYAEYLGTVSQLTGLRCGQSMSPSNPRDIWSFKRGKLTDWLYLGKANSRLDAPCDAIVGKAGTLAFTPTYRIAPDGLVKVEEKGDTISLTDVEEVIFRSQFK